MGIELIVEDNADAASSRAADIVAAAISRKPRLSVVFATGNSPMALYAELARRQAEGLVDARGVKAFQLDAYLGTADTDPRSLFGWMDRAVLQPLSIPPERVVRFPERIDDPQAACEAFAQEIERSGGFDLSILGLGPNGHLGFNEPPSDETATTRAIGLTPESVASNAVYWGGEDHVPRGALTVGMDALLAARQTVLVVLGARKHAILHAALEGPVTPDVPASFLQGAANVTVVADRAAWTGRD